MFIFFHLPLKYTLKIIFQGLNVSLLSCFIITLFGFLCPQKFLFQGQQGFSLNAHMHPQPEIFLSYELFLSLGALLSCKMDHCYKLDSPLDGTRGLWKKYIYITAFPSFYLPSMYFTTHYCRYMHGWSKLVDVLALHVFNLESLKLLMFHNDSCRGLWIIA